MAATNDHAVTPNEDRVVQRLRECGTSSLEEISRSAGVDWVTAFSIIDRLSRVGSVVLRKHGADYQVSLERGT